MDLFEAVKKRHSVRSYLDKPIEDELVQSLNEKILQINNESGLDIQLVTNEPNAFSCFLAHYGKFVNCNNYITICGKRGLDEKVGYYGEKLVLEAQMLGLNTCWVALSYSRKNVPVKAKRGEKFYIVISVGYGRNRGLPRKSKKMEQLCRACKEMPKWFENGMDFAMRAPTAINQQKFLITLINDEKAQVRAKSLLGPCHKIDLGIVKLHFEIGAQRKINWV